MSLGSNYGGWGFNNYLLKKTPMPVGGGPQLAPVDMTPAEAAANPFFLDSDLQAEPFFKPGGFFTKVGIMNPRANHSGARARCQPARLFMNNRHWAASRLRTLCF